MQRLLCFRAAAAELLQGEARREWPALTLKAGLVQGCTLTRQRQTSLFFFFFFCGSYIVINLSNLFPITSRAEKNVNMPLKLAKTAQLGNFDYLVAIFHQHNSKETWCGQSGCLTAEVLVFRLNTRGHPQINKPIRKVERVSGLTVVHCQLGRGGVKDSAIGKVTT